MPAQRRPSTKAKRSSPSSPPPGRPRVSEILNRMGPVDREVAIGNLRRDSWVNVATGMGVLGRDRRMSGEFDIRAQLRSLERWDELYRGNDMAANIVDAQPDAMTREGWQPRIAEDQDGEQEEALTAREEDLNVGEHIAYALKMANALGGSAILLGADDGLPADQPLREDRIRSLDWITVLTPRELWVTQYYQEKGAPKFAEPELYQVVNVDGDNKDLLGGQGGHIHESRLIRFEGVRVNHRVRRMQRGWGDPILLRCSETLRDFNMSWAGAASIMHDFSQAMLKVKGLAEMIGEDGDEAVTKRAQALSIARSLAGLLILDEEEEFKRETASVAGFAELLTGWGGRLAASARMPISVLMGQQPGGLNGGSAGQADIRNWYDQCRSAQVRKLKRPLLRLWKLLFLAQDGITAGEEPENYTVQFNPLWQLSEAEKADLRLKTAQADQIWVNLGMLPATTAAKQRFGGPSFDPETHLTDDDLNAMDEADQLDQEQATLMQQAQQKQLQAAAGSPGGATEAGSGDDPAAAPPGSATRKAPGGALAKRGDSAGGKPSPKGKGRRKG